MATVEIFISLSHEDNAFCQQLVDALSQAGADVWYDEHSMEAGRVMQVVERELRHRPVFIVILSPSALKSSWVHDECTWAYARLRRDPTRIILPIVAAPFDEDALWLFLQEFRRIEARGTAPLSPEEAIRRTLHALALALPGEAPVTVHMESGDRAEDLLNQAKPLLAQHRYDEATPLVERAVQLAPESF